MTLNIKNITRLNGKSTATIYDNAEEFIKKCIAFFFIIKYHEWINEFNAIKISNIPKESASHFRLLYIYIGGPLVKTRNLF